MGLSNYPDIELDQLFSKADAMLYTAKSNGRNRIEY
jgi:PleD family two-component response regulator